MSSAKASKFARMQYTLEEVNLKNPLKRKKIGSDWDGLE